MDGRSLPLHDKRRQQHRDDHLWRREQERATLYKLKRLHCPCCRCKGRVQCSLAKVKDHLIHFGREPAFRVWRGPGARDASDDEWEQEFRRPCGENDGQFDEGLDMQGMVADAFLQCDEPCEPKMMLTCVLNPLKPLEVIFWCFMFIHKNIKRVKCGVDLSLDFRSSCVVVLKFYLNRELP